MTTDPVCEMDVDKNDPPAQAEYQGETYYFCGDGCREEFEENPQQYA